MTFSISVVVVSNWWELKKKNLLRMTFLHSVRITHCCYINALI